MALTLDKYAELLDTRGEPRPEGPEPIPFEKVRPAVPRLRELKAITLGGFGTTMLIRGNESKLLPDDQVQRKIALDKTIKEFKMWQSMSRKPGDPSDYMDVIVRRQLDQLALSEFAGKDTFGQLEKVWAGVVNTLMQKEYTYDVGMYGDFGSFCSKIVYYFLMAAEGMSIYPDLYRTLAKLRTLGIPVGVHIDTQSNGPARLHRLLLEQGRSKGLHELLDPQLSIWAFQTGVRVTSERGWATLVDALKSKGFEPEQCVYVGSDMDKELVPAKRRGFKVALLLADTQSAKVTREQLKEPRTRPDALLSKLSQLVDLAEAVQPG